MNRKRIKTGCLVASSNAQTVKRIKKDIVLNISYIKNISSFKKIKG